MCRSRGKACACWAGAESPHAAAAEFDRGGLARAPLSAVMRRQARDARSVRAGFLLVGIVAALAEVKYERWVTTEISGGDAAYLKDVVARLDKIFAGQKPFTPPA